MRTIKITLPLPPNMANSRMHWRVKQKAKKAYWEACGPVALAHDFYTQVRFGVVHDKTKLRATIYCGGRMDDDNAIARLKWPVDWLVSQGLLVDDKPAHLEWHWPVGQVVGRKQTYRVEFELEAA